MKRRLRPSPEKLLALIVVGLFLAHLGRPDNLLYPPGSPYSDLMLTHWPNAHFFRQSVWRDHAWPLWNPDQFSGLPFAANPLSGLWYPPNWLFLILPLTPAFNLLLALHLCLGGLGMMRLVRRLGGGAEGALVAGLAWALTPKIWAHLGAGHVGLVYAAGWLPWVASAAVQLIRSPSPIPHHPFPITHSPLPIIWALQFLADPRLAAYTAVGVAAAALWWVAGRWSNLPYKEIHHGDTENSEGKNGKDSVPHMSWRSVPGSVSPWFFILSLLKMTPAGPWLAAGALALALTAVQWLPLLDYLPTTSRPELTVGESAVYSLPPDKLLGLLWASQSGFQEWVTYVGISVLVLALLGWLTIPRRARWGAALGLVLLVLFALGDNGPLYPLVARLPGATLLRVPPRIWFLVSFGLATLAGLGADALVCGGRSLTRYRRGLNRLAVAGLGLTGMMAVGVWFVNRPVVGALSAAFCWLLMIVAACLVSQRMSWPAWATGGLLVLLVTAELFWADSLLVTPRPAEQLFADGWETAVYLAGREGRVYAPSFRPPPQVVSVLDIRVANGVEPLYPESYAVFLNTATGIPTGGEYSVILPPLPKGSLEDDTGVGLALADAVPDPWLLAVLDVDTVVSQFPLDSPWLTEIYRHEREELIVYHNRADIHWPAVFQRVESVLDLEAALAWLETGALTREAVVIGGRSLEGPPGHTPAELLSHTPNRLLLRAIGPGLLIVNELVHPGWKATVDGVPAEIVAADGVLRGVYLEEGVHEVEMVYRPWSVTAGMIVSSLALVIWLLGVRDGSGAVR